MTETSPMLIRSDRLAVEIAAPGSVYRRTRFDWSGFITQVTLDGKHTFCVPEDLDPEKGTGGIGLCGEFGIEQAVGYDDAEVGEAFPKLGVGLLTKADGNPYNFMRGYEVAALFPIRVECSENQAVFTVEPVTCNGYAARTIKTIRVEGNRLEVKERLENLGTKPIATDEYFHNFIGIDGQNIGPEYQLSFPYTVRFQKMIKGFRKMLPGILRFITPDFVLERRMKKFMDDSVLRVEGKTIGFRATPQKPFYTRPQGFFKTNQAQWEIMHTPSGVGLREYDDFDPLRVALWGNTHVVSAEVFVKIQSAPGETQEWTRRYEFLD